LSYTTGDIFFCSCFVPLPLVYGFFPFDYDGSWQIRDFEFFFSTLSGLRELIDRPASFVTFFSPLPLWTLYTHISLTAILSVASS